MTRKEFSERCKEIMASTALTTAEKGQKIRHEAALLIDDTFPKSPEGRDFWKRNEAAEKKLAGHGGYSYCPHDGEWSPVRPPAIKALDREYGDLKHRMTEETFRKVWAKKAA
jgi:hypothetical protein